jgi:hypothetical protein
MKKLVSRMIAVGGIAMMAATIVPTSTLADQRPVDTAGLIIECAISVEQTAIRCKGDTLKTLEECLDETDSPADVTKCDRAAEGALGKCELTGAAGDLRCQINPTVPNKQ